eukprot:175486-Rhodomonas_salina.1
MAGAAGRAEASTERLLLEGKADGRSPGEGSKSGAMEVANQEQPGSPLNSTANGSTTCAGERGKEVADQGQPGSPLNSTANGSTTGAGEGGNSGGMEVDDQEQPDSELTCNSMVEEGRGGERQSMQPSTPSLAVPAAVTVTPPVARAEEHGAETEDEAPP